MVGLYQSTRSLATSFGLSTRPLRSSLARPSAATTRSRGLCEREGRGGEGRGGEGKGKERRGREKCVHVCGGEHRTDEGMERKREGFTAKHLTPMSLLTIGELQPKK